jgi:hypothetical protein
MGPAQGKEKRGRPRKNPQPSAPAPTLSKRKPAKVSKPAGPGTRFGASQQLPIIIDSDEADSDEAEDQGVGIRDRRGYVIHIFSTNEC